MLKASIPFWTVLITFGLGLEPFQPKLVATVMWIGLGVIVAAKGELAFDTLGTSLAVAGIICECVRLVLSQKLLQSAEIKFNPITGVFYTAPLSFLTLMIPFLLLERHEFGEFIFGVDAVTGRMKLWEIMPHMIGNGCMAFMLNLVVFNFIQVRARPAPLARLPARPPARPLARPPVAVPSLPLSLPLLLLLRTPNF